MAVYDAADALIELPRRGRAGRKPGTREIAVTGLLSEIIYFAGEEAVEIIRILHGSQQWP